MTRRLLPLTLLLGALLAFPNVAIAGLGFQGFDTAITNADGSPDTQAGSHPFQLTTKLSLTTTTNALGETVPSGAIRTIRVDLPPGLVGSATAVPQCSQQQFATLRESKSGSGIPSCENGSAVGVAEVKLAPGPEGVYYVPIYNLAPPPGMPAEFGFNFDGGIPVVLVPSVRSASDYGVRVESVNTSQGAELYESTITFWGVPADPRHDEMRGTCLSLTGGPTGETCPAGVEPRPLLTLPSACSGPLSTTVSADSWEEPEWVLGPVALSHDQYGDPVGVDGCNQLNFQPSFSFQPETTVGDSPTGAEVALSLPQNEQPEGLAEADVRRVVTALPVGMSVSPSAANGREACSEAQIGLHSGEPARCPEASKIGSVKVQTPLLEAPLEGWVYLAQQDSNPYGGLLGLYLVAEGSGVRIKLAGGVEADPHTGQLTARFEERSVGSSSSPSLPLAFPQLPFGKLTLKLFGGPRAPLVTPASCGTYTTEAQLTPWSSPSQTPVEDSSSFTVDSACAGQFDPSFAAGTTDNRAGAFSPFVASFSRQDADRDLGEVSVTAPPGLLGMLSGVLRCGEPQAQLGTCPAASQIGHATVSAGAGSDPVVLPQAGRPEDPVYLTGPYGGAPFGLAIVVHAEAGPFNLGTVVVRAAVGIDPHTAQVSANSGPLPQILQGIPTQVKTVTVTVDRPGFIFNPTSCNPLAVTATATSAQGDSATLTNRYQAADCANLGFKPVFRASTGAHPSRADGASLKVKVTAHEGPQAAGGAGDAGASGEANIAKVELTIPKRLPSRLSTIQKACPASVFEANPAACPAASDIASVVVHTPLLSLPLSGPAYFVSHGGAAFPDVEIVLQGEGITLILDGKTQTKGGVTHSRFESVPDAPFSVFEFDAPQGPHSILAANLPARAHGSMCGLRLTIPTTLTAQNGAVLRQSTPVAVSGCPKKKPKHRGKAARRPN